MASSPPACGSTKCVGQSDRPERHLSRVQNAPPDAPKREPQWDLLPSVAAGTLTSGLLSGTRLLTPWPILNSVSRIALLPQECTAVLPRPVKGHRRHKIQT